MPHDAVASLEESVPDKAVRGALPQASRRAAGDRGEALREPRATPYWQAAPMALVFFLFFVLPLIVTLIVSLLELHRVFDRAGLHLQ